MGCHSPSLGEDALANRLTKRRPNILFRASGAAHIEARIGDLDAKIGFTVAAATPTLSFGSISNQTYGVAAFAISATSNSTGAITYSVISGPATISGNTVTLTGPGTVTLQASQAAAANYITTTATISFTVTAATPTLSFASISNQR
jgi:hypothetical protein